MHFVSILCCECKCICRGTTFALAKLSIPACCVVCVHVASLPGYDAGPAPAQEPGNKAIANVRQDTAWVLSYWTFWTFSSSSYADKVEWLRRLTIACVVTCVVLCVVGAIFWFAFGGVVSEPPNNSKT